MKRLFTTACILLGLCLSGNAARADLLANIRAQGKIRVAIGASTPPYSYVNSNKQLTGSDVETARLLAKDLGVKLEIVRIQNSDRISVLQERRADLVIAVLSITPERERQIAFSVPYSKIAIVIASTQPHQFSSMLDLHGKTIGALANSSNYGNLVHDVADANVIVYPENDKLLAGYVAGEFDIISTPETLVEAHNLTKPKRPLYTQFVQSVFDIGIGIPSGEKPLRDWVNAWVVSNLQNENLGTIYRKYFGRSLPRDILPGGDASKK
jgi:polar amino acid transport system substrate-binding protein